VSKLNSLSILIMRSPLFWGTAATLCFFAPLQAGWLSGDVEAFVRRYFAGHPILCVETTAFFVGLSSLVLKALDVSRQASGLSRISLGPVAAGGQPAADSERLLTALAEMPPTLRDSYLWRRLHAGLEHVRRKGSADTIEDELKYLSELDAGRQHASGGLVRIIIWAIPILGFLGTVVGITLAIANLSPQQLEGSLATVVAGLGVAFDTTALALGLSMVLMFIQFLTDRAESRLLDRVDERAADELSGRFILLGSGGDPQVAAMRRIADAVLHATERLVGRQAELWQSTIDAAHQRWSRLTSSSQEHLEGALAQALTRSLDAHRHALAEAEQRASTRTETQAAALNEALVKNAEAVRSQHAELARQGEVMLRVIDATGQVVGLEDALNRNLASLAGAQQFEELIGSLSAAIHLLNVRLGTSGQAVPHVDLHTRREDHQAA